ncbi:MAG: type II secretion system F family protein [Actinomycetota bacterium]
MMSASRRVTAALAVVAILVVFAVGVGPASAQEQADIPYSAVTEVRAAGDAVNVTVLRSEYAVTSSQIQLSENGQEIGDVDLTTAAALGRPIEVIYVLDVDNRSVINAGLSIVAGGIEAAIDELPAETKVGLVTAGREAEIQSRPSTNRTRIRTALQGAVAEQGASIVDGIALAAASFSDAPDAVRSIIVVTTGSDTASARSAADAEAATVQAGAQAIWVGTGPAVNGLQQIVNRTGGVVVDAGSVEGIPAAVDRTTGIAANRLVLSYEGTGERGDRMPVSLAIAGASVDFSYPVGLDTTGAFQLAAIASANPIERGFFGQPAVMYVSVALAAIAIALAVGTLGSMFAGGETSLDNLLARYSDRDENLEEEEVQEMLVQSALVRRAVDITESFAEQRGFLARIEELLERANVPVAAGEGLFFLSAIVFVASAISLVTSGSLFAAVAVALIVGVGGYAAVVALARRRVSQFESQLPDTLQLLSGTLKAGYSLPQGLEAVSTEIADPMGYELRRAITEAQLGREIEDALAGVAERLGSPDFAWVVMAIGIQREVGGNLAEVLLTVAETMMQRDRLSREVSALTAEGRVSAGILAMLPPGLGVVMYVMNPGYIGVLFDRTFGLVLIGLAVLSGITGLIWMKKVITIDV